MRKGAKVITKELLLKRQITRLRVTPLLVLLVIGCDSQPEDARSWPVRVELFHQFDPSVTDCEKLEGAAQGSSRLLLAKFSGSRTVKRLEVVDLADRKVYWQHVFTTTGNHAEESSCTYMLIPGAQRVTSTGVWIFVACYADKVAHLMRVHYPRNQVDTLLSRFRDPAVPADVGFDISFSGPYFAPDSNATGAPGICKVGYGYYPGHRELILLDPEALRQLVASVPTGNPLGPPVVWADLNRDGESELLLESTAPGARRQEGGLSDTTAYYAALGVDGRWLWAHPTGGGGGSAMLHWERDGAGGRLFGWRSYRNFGPAKVHTFLHELEPARGRILREKRVQGLVYWPAPSWSDTLHWALQLDVQEGRLRWLTRAFVPIGEWSSLRGVTEFVPQPLPAVQGGLLLQAVTADGTVWLLDDQLRPQGRSRLRALFDPAHHLMPDDVDSARHRPIRLFVTRAEDGALSLARLDVRPFWAWWGWRWRWILALGFSLPLVALAVFNAIRFVRLKRASRRELERQNRRLEIYSRELKQLLLRLHGVQEDERARIARDLHDELGQQLITLRQGLRLLPPTRPLEDGRPGTDQLVATVDEALAEMRRMVHELRPLRLERLGLAAALEGELDRRCSPAGLNWRLEGTAACPALPLAVSLPVFRILQEALTNVIKHAAASQVLLTIEAQRGYILLSLEDDGVGVSEAAPGSEAMGLIGMRERAESLGATVEVAHRAGGGTVVRLELPVDAGGLDVSTAEGPPR